MKTTITSIRLKSPFHFFALSYRAMNVLRQLRNTPCVAVKTRGLWTTHYTMTLWENERHLKDFARSGAHLEAMKVSTRIAREIRTLTIEADSLPDWKRAKELLGSVEAVRYSEKN